MNKKITKILKNPMALFLTLGIRGVFNWMPDEQYIRIAYRCKMHKKLDLNNPQTFNEKLQWLKLYDRKSEYSLLVDKYEAKKRVAERIGEEYIIPSLGVWNSFDEIDFSSFPKQFVLKCTHDSGSIVICKDKSMFDKEKAKSVLNTGLKHKFFWAAREWPYKEVRPRIIAEKYVCENKHGDLKDYKFFCFNGKVKCFKIDYDRFSRHRANYYDINMKQLPFGEKEYPFDINKKVQMPANLTQMIKLAEKIAKDIPFVRVDFYNCGGKIYFGEITFYPAGGWGVFDPEEWDYVLGSWIELPSIK